MGKINPETPDESVNQMAEASLHINYPNLVCGVSRKINIGNYENIDVFASISIPVLEIPHEDLEAFKEAVAEAAQVGFSIASMETGERYHKIKELQSGG